jgi:hypothetical protein
VSLPQPLIPGATPWAQDALWPGPLMRDRLRTEVPELRLVELADDIDAGATTLPQLPGAMLMLADLQPTADSTTAHRVARVQQVWLVQLVIDASAPDTDRITTTAGPLISACIRALHGWSPRQGPGGQALPVSWLPRNTRPSHGNPTLMPLFFGVTVPTV